MIKVFNDIKCSLFLGFFCNLCTEKLQLTTKRSRMIGGVLFLLCAVLFLATLTMGLCWPRVKKYMLEDVCVDKDCVEAASQVRIYIGGI